jgi:hypothetical protein
MTSIPELIAAGITRALIIRSPHIEKILNRTKTWEMRGTKTTVRGRIALIRGGSCQIVGLATMYGSLPALTEDRWEETRQWHQVEDLERLRKWRFPWQMIDAQPLETPIPYQHPRGAVLWVDLTALEANQPTEEP